MTRLLPGVTLVWYLALVAIVGTMWNREPTEGSSIAVFPREAPTELAVTVLRQSTVLTSAAVGYAGTTPTEVLAWRFLVEAPNAESLFLEVFSNSPNRAGQLWALAGLRVVSPQVFERKAGLLGQDPGEVETMIGCIVSPRPIRVVLNELRRFDWVRDYLRNRGPAV